MDLLNTPHDDEIDLFADIIRTEALIAEESKLAKQAAAAHNAVVSQAQTKLTELWRQMADHMKATGQVEMILPGDVTDYKIAVKRGSERVVVADPDAVPEEFVKMERKPMLTEIKKHITDLPEGESINWATVERCPDSYGWKAVKKGKGSDVEA